MLRKLIYCRQAFLPTDAKLLYCAVLINPLNACREALVLPLFEVFCAKMRAFPLHLSNS
jgi:hypothetical protein